MATSSKSTPSLIKWYVLLVSLAVMAIVLLALFSDTFITSQPGSMPQVVWLLIGIVIIIALITLLVKTISLADSIENNNIKLEKIFEGLEKNCLVLAEIRQSVYLTEAAKNILYRETDARAIRQVIFDKLRKQDFDASQKLIDELDKIEQFKVLAVQMRDEVNKFLSAPDSEKEEQLITDIDKLLDEFQWAKASAQIEDLIKKYPTSEKAKMMSQKLADRKEMRKKTLLQLWDEAVKRQATDRSLEVLAELDQYLTPNEGLALQEAARDAFKNKLHSLGVRFAMAVSGKQWQKAVETGRQIVRDFPNSKMAEEIRERMTVLEQRISESK